MSGPTHSSNIRRRNPRQDRIIRNRLHPEYAALVANTSTVRGPSGVLRKNPHIACGIGLNGIKRIDRSAKLLGSDAPLYPTPRRATSNKQESQLPLVVVENPDFYIVTVLDMVGGRLTAQDKDVLGQAHNLLKSGDKGDDQNGAVVAVVFGELKETALDLAGADRLIHLPQANYQGYKPEQRVAALQAIEHQLSPRYWLFPASMQGGSELGSRLAAKLGERPAVNAWQVDLDETMCRGGSERIDIRRRTPRLLLLAEECALPVDETRHEVRRMDIEELIKEPRSTALSEDQRIQDCGQVDIDPSQIALAEAEFVLSAGNGITDWEGFHYAAEVLGATEGGSRVVVDNGCLPRDRQVGASGTWVAARVYIAAGISGAIQHLQGITQCDKVIAINTDAGCDMVKRADLSVIGDANQILSELTRLVEQRRVGGNKIPENNYQEVGDTDAAL